MKISAVVLTRNEEKNLSDCLSSLKWCDEIIVVDDNSRDNTAKIALQYGAKIIRHSLCGDFSQQRNFGLSKAKNEWVLFVDADERVSRLLFSEISNLKSELSNKINAYYLKRRDFIWGIELKHGETGDIKLLRLAKKSAGKWEGKVHEIWRVNGPTAELKNSLIHYPHQSIPDFLKEINQYTSFRAQELYEKKVKSSFWSILIYPKGKFIKNYFFKKGFQDGLPGLIMAFMMSFHSFLVRAKLYLLWRKN